jgi:hypothetical protein
MGDCEQLGTYVIINVDFSLTNPFISNVSGTYLDLIDTNIDITKIYIGINNGDLIRADKILPLKSNFQSIRIKSDVIGYAKFIVGNCFFSDKTQVIAQVSPIQVQELLPNNIDVSVTTTPAPITSQQTLVKMVIIVNASATDALLGTASKQNIPIKAGSNIAIVTPKDTVIDLAKLYVVSTANITLNVMWWS